MRARALHITLFALGVCAVLSCKKDKVPAPEPLPEPTKWEVIAGHYKVYDTMGVYLYEMDIVYIPKADVQSSDSLRFENFDGDIVFTHVQSNANLNGFPTYFFSIGLNNPVYDSAGKRWRIFEPTDPNYNYLENDTIRLSFERSNLQYYIEDLVPYYSCECKQIAVKQ